MSSVMDARRILDAAYASDLGLFAERAFAEVNPGQVFESNWHLVAIAHELTRVLHGETTRLLITMPPRSLKSHYASIAFPAWVLGQDPTRRIVCVSYSTDLAVALSNACRKLMNAPWYRRVFPGGVIDPSKDTETESRMRGSGYRLSTTIGGTLTGRGGSLLLIDDPLKASDAHSEAARTRVNTWFDQTLLSRLATKRTGAIVVIMQRLHVEDLAGHVLKQGGRRHLNLPAIAERPMEIAIGEGRFYHHASGEILHPKRDDAAILESLKVAMGSQAFAAQYQQDPVPPGGAMIRSAWLQYHDAMPVANDTRSRIVQSWDTASKSGELNDCSVGITALLRENVFYILDVVRTKLDYPDLKRKIVDTARAWSADDILIEDKGSGTSLLQDLRQVGHYGIAIQPIGDKVVRMSTCTAVMEAGRVRLPKAAPWLGEFTSELLAFPYGAHDDQADALSQMINWNRTRSHYNLANLVGC